MSWRDRYRPGSFRGVPFRTRENETSGGRRVETHEYPRRDTPWSEDLGRTAHRQSLEMFVAGPEYMTARDTLIAALDKHGPGTLVHPWRGTLSVSVTDWRCRESTDEGGIASFSVDFVEAGQAIERAASTDTGAIAKATASAAIAVAPARFASVFDVSRVASFVEDGATALVRASATAAAIAGGLQGGAGGALRAFEAGLAFLPASALALVRAPLQLATAVVGLVGTVGALGGSPFARIAGLSSLVGFRSAVGVAATPARIREVDNAAAYVDLFTTVATAELVRAIADAPIASQQDAVALRDAAAELIEARIVETSDNGEDDVAATFVALLQAMVADVSARGGTLARVYGYTPARTEPALAIAARLYGAGGAMIARVDDIVARNRIRHPGFVAGGRRIEVLEVPRG